MKVVILGAGEVGLKLAESIRRKGHDVLIIDKKKRACEKARALDVMVVNGNGARPELLNSLDIKTVDYFFAVTDDNETNLVACSIAKSAGCRTLARINGLEYISRPVTTKFSTIGVDYAVSPELIIARKIADIISLPSTMEKTEIMGGKVDVIVYRVLPKSRARGKRIASLRLPPNVNLGAIIRDDQILVPHGKNRLKEDDTLIVMTTELRSELMMRKLIGEKKEAVKKVTIIGGTPIGINVAKILEERDIYIKLIDSSMKRARTAAEALESTEVVVGDAKDKQILFEEELFKADAIVAAYRSEELNVLITLLAKVYDVDKAVAVIRKLGLKSLIETVGIDMAASPELQTADTMLGLARRLEPLKAIPIYRGDLYLLEMRVSEDSKVLGKRISQCDLPEKSLIGAMIRKGRTIIPRGSETFQEDDLVLFFVLKTEIGRVEDMF